jgi:hypothetical protein
MVSALHHGSTSYQTFLTHKSTQLHIEMFPPMGMNMNLDDMEEPVLQGRNAFAGTKPPCRNRSILVVGAGAIIFA